MAYPTFVRDGFCLYKCPAGMSGKDPVFNELCNWSGNFGEESKSRRILQRGQNQARENNGPLAGLLAERPGFKYHRRPNPLDGNWVVSDYITLPEDLWFIIPVELYVRITEPEVNEIGEVSP